MIGKQDIDSLISLIADLYMSDNRPWMIGYSGGKDSTAILQLVWLALQRLEHPAKPVYVINTDTGVENPVIYEWVNESLANMKVNAGELPIEVHQIRPAPDQTYWTYLIGRGYPVPGRMGRWCTDRLKIKPVNKFIQERIDQHDEVIMVLGTRKAESSNRKRSMEKMAEKRTDQYISPSPTMNGEYIFSPIEDWTTDDVWNFLMSYRNPWGTPNQKLLKLYAGASSEKECPLQLDASSSSCGQSRFGCWICTLVSKDHSTEAMIRNNPDHGWMESMLRFRDKLMDRETDKSHRHWRKTNGSLQGFHGRLNHGYYFKEYREQLLKEIFEIENKTGYQIISLEELQAIRRIWVYERHEFDDSLPQIYEQAKGIPFSDPDWQPPPFGRTEWETLKRVCHKVAPEEELLLEMMAQMFLGVDPEKAIKTHMYQNEKDALDYYTRQQEKLRDSGKKYNTKFFEGIPEFDQGSLF